MINLSNSEVECKEAKHKLELVKNDILDYMTERNANLVKEQLACIDTLDGKLCPRPKEPPTAKNLVISSQLRLH